MMIKRIPKIFLLATLMLLFADTAFAQTDYATIIFYRPSKSGTANAFLYNDKSFFAKLPKEGKVTYKLYNTGSIKLAASIYSPKKLRSFWNPLYPIKEVDIEKGKTYYFEVVPDGRKWFILAQKDELDAEDLKKLDQENFIEITENY